MTRLVIDVTGAQHQKIKTLAALQGKTIKEFVLEKVLVGNLDDEDAWEEMQALLLQRIEAAEAGAISDLTMSQIAKDKIKELEVWKWGIPKKKCTK